MFPYISVKCLRILGPKFKGQKNKRREVQRSAKVKEVNGWGFEDLAKSMFLSLKISALIFWFFWVKPKRTMAKTFF
jgi:hypothetical protein